MRARKRPGKRAGSICEMEKAGKLKNSLPARESLAGKVPAFHYFISSSNGSIIMASPRSMRLNSST
jgi:hypothetical protein